MAFDVEKSIAAWRRPYEVNSTFSGEDLEELENSLRDRIDDLIEEGKSTEDAFRIAVGRIGSISSAEDEYKKVYWGKVKRERRLNDELFLRISMVKNYVTIAFRNLRRHSGYTAISALGLAVGMAACLLIGLYVGDELSYDDFHTRAERIHVLGVDNNFFGRSRATSYPLASVLEESIPTVERAVRTIERENIMIRRPGYAVEARRKLLLADASLLQVFDFPLVQGHRDVALNGPGAAVITEAMALDFFGGADPIGNVLQVELRDSTHSLMVRGVVKDIPGNSTIQFDVLVPLSLLGGDLLDSEAWGRRMFSTYALLNQPLPPDTLAAQAEGAVEAIRGEASSQSQSFFSVPLPQLYLSDQYNTEGFRGQQRYLYIFGSVALFILLIAAINYVNLVTAQSQRRAKEVGVRKTMGGRRGQLAGQFLSESLLLVVAALVMALGLMVLALPVFNASFGTELRLFSGGHAVLIAGLTASLLVTGIIAGGYPAFVLSRFQPANVLRGTASAAAGRGGWLQRGLVVVQFALSAAIIVGTIVVHQQLGYMQEKNLGFDDEQVVVVGLSQSEVALNAVTVKDELLRHPAVEKVSMAGLMPGHGGMLLGMPPEEVSSEAISTQELFSWVPIHTDSAFVETLGLQLVAGRSFGSQAGSSAEVLINELASRELGWLPAEAIGKPFWLEQGGEGIVVGVVSNFHHASLREAIRPVVISISDQNNQEWIAAKLAADGIQEGMDHVRLVLGSLAPGAVLDYQFLDETFDAMYRSEERLSQIFTAFAGIAIFISCLGLLGLAAYAAQRRTKEIGVRKVMGASLANIISLLSKEFAALLAVALAIGMPIAYWAMQQWLEEFAFQTTMSGWTFLLTAFIVITIAGGSVSMLATRAAHTNPADALRNE